MLLVEDERRPGEARDRGAAAEQPREAADLAVHVLLAALDDELLRDVGGDDLGPFIGRGAEHAHRVVVREHDMLHRLVRHAADARDHVPRHVGRRLRIDDEYGIVADHHAGIRVALRGVAVESGAELVEGDLLLGEILGAGETGHR